MTSPLDLAQRLMLFEARSRCYAARGYDRLAAARLVAAVLEQVSGHVLDVGTGQGSLAISLAARGISVVTVDPDTTDRELVAQRSKDAGLDARLRIVTADAAALPHPDAHFAAATCMDVLHHLADPEPVLKEMVRTLAPQGELLLADFSREGMALVARVHEDEGRVHPDSGVTIDMASGVLQQLGLSPVLKLTRHLHDIAVFARTHEGGSQGVLDNMRSAVHPRCLACGRDNPGGLHLDFALQPDRSVQGTFPGGVEFQGYPDAVHGGLIATLLDAAMTNCLFARGVVAVTARLSVRYLEPGRWQQPCDVTARLDRSTHRVHYLTAEVRQDGCAVARASGTFITRPR